MSNLRRIIKEQMQAEVQNKIRQIVVDNLHCDQFTFEKLSGIIHIRNLHMELQDIKIEPGTVSIALNLISGGWLSEFDDDSVKPRSLMDLTGLTLRPYFMEKYRKMRYFNVKQLHVHISSEGINKAIKFRL
jgi:hypothetical protein